LADGGVDVVLAEYRGYGGQPGRPDEEGLSADGAALLAALAAEGVTPDRLVLVGRSLGTGVAVELALRTPPALLVLVSPYTSFPDLGRTLVGPLAPLVVPDRFDNLGKIGRLSCPVVILHGTRDEVVPFRMGEVLARAGRNVRFLALEGRTHNDIPDLPALLLAEIRRGTGD
ncbi:MAG TPA: alpha/beta hydrolase, partial [Thermoanaerobaculia bacterium]|nr:alpha/beta hydrolase [Thermoanaerobaculia bacterium]